MTRIEFPKTVDRSRWVEVPEIILEAKEIAKSTNDRRRTFEQKMIDSMNGLTLQYAVADALSQAGYEMWLAPRTDKSFDFEISAVRIDIKGIFKANAKAFTQSEWERANALPTTIYACYDCTGDSGVFKGWCKHGDFQLSQFTGYMIYPNRLTTSGILIPPP